MKVRETALSPAALPGTSRPASSRAEEREDRVSVAHTRALEATLAGAKQSAGASRAARIAALEASLRDGSFRANPAQVAERLLEAAALEARLRSMLEKE